MTLFNTQAYQYENHSGLQRVLARELINLCPNKNYKDILELGCGTGYLTEKLTQKYPQANITSLDSSSNMLKVLQQKKYSDTVKLIQNNIENFSPEQKYDLIISNLSFQWINSPLQEIERYANFIKPNGFLAINLPHNQSFRELQKSCQESSLPYYGLTNSYSKEKLANLQQKFTLLEKSSTSYFTSTQAYYRNLHQLGAIKQANKLKASQLHKLIQHHNSKYTTTLIPFEYKYLLISCLNSN